MDDDDGYFFTREEIKLMFKMTLKRIDALEKKAIRRLIMTEDEKTFFRAKKLMDRNPELRDLIVTFIIAGSGGN